MGNNFRNYLIFGALILFFFSSAKMITSDYLQLNKISEKLDLVETEETEKGADLDFSSDPIESYRLTRPALDGSPVECVDDGPCFSWSTNPLPQRYIWDTSCASNPNLGKYYWRVYKNFTYYTQITTSGPSVEVCIDDTDAPYDVTVTVRADNCYFYSDWSDHSAVGTVAQSGQGPCD